MLIPYLLLAQLSSYNQHIFFVYFYLDLSLDQQLVNSKADLILRRLNADLAQTYILGGYIWESGKKKSKYMK